MAMQLLQILAKPLQHGRMAVRLQLHMIRNT